MRLPRAGSACGIVLEILVGLRSGGYKLRQIMSWAVVLLVTMTGCIFPSDPTSGLGVTLDNGDVVALFNLCPGQSVRELQVETAGDFPPDEAEVLWQIKSSDNGVSGEIELGSAPEGYAELVALDVDLMALDVFGLSADLEDIQVGTSVTTSDLSEDRVVLDGHFFTRDEFLALDCNY